MCLACRHRWFLFKYTTDTFKTKTWADFKDQSGRFHSEKGQANRFCPHVHICLHYVTTHRSQLEKYSPENGPKTSSELPLYFLFCGVQNISHVNTLISVNIHTSKGADFKMSDRIQTFREKKGIILPKNPGPLGSNSVSDLRNSTSIICHPLFAHFESIERICFLLLQHI